MFESARLRAARVSQLLVIGAAALGATATISAPAAAAPTESQRAFVVDLKPGKADSVRNLELVVTSDESDTSRAVKAELRVEKELGKPAEQVLRFSLDVGVDVALATAELVDIDYDGYKDFWIVREMGSKWARVEVYLFDAKSGRFVKDGLAREIEKLDNPELAPTSKSIISSRIGPTEPQRTVRKVDGRRLQITDRCVFHNDKDVDQNDTMDGLLVIEKLVKGVLSVVTKKTVSLPRGENPCLTSG